MGEEGLAWPRLKQVLDLAAIAISAEQMGGAQQILDMTVAYTGERYQFNRPIASFQAVNRRCRLVSPLALRTSVAARPESPSLPMVRFGLPGSTPGESNCSFAIVSIEPHLHDQNVEVRLAAIGVLSELEARTAVHALASLLSDQDLKIRQHAVSAIGDIGGENAVMYLGRLCEVAPVDNIFDNPLHPYTQLLLETIPDVEMTGRKRAPVAGEIPNPIDPPSGCPFHPRCPEALARCGREQPGMCDYGSGHLCRCPVVFGAWK